ARQVEIEVVLPDLVMRYEAGVARVRLGIREDINNLVQVALTEAVLVAVFDEALAGIDHKNALAGGGVFLIEHKDTSRNAGAVKEIGWQANDALEIAGANELGADDGLGIAAKED